MTKTLENRKIFAAATLLFAAATIFTHSKQNTDSILVSAIHLRVPQGDTRAVPTPDANPGDATLALNLHQK